MNKILYTLLLLSLVLLGGCHTNSQNKIKLASVPLTSETFQVHNLDSTKLLNPRNIFYFDNHIVLLESNNEPIFSFWSTDNLDYEFSDGHKGGGPNEFIHPGTKYFEKTDSCFYILDSHIEKQVQLVGNKIHVINETPIVFNDAINQLVNLGDGTYIMAGMTDGSDNAEHVLLTPAGKTTFGEFPEQGMKDGIEKFMLNYKITAGKIGQKSIWDFYIYHNLIRQYSIDGKLLREISLELDNDSKNSASMLSDGSAISYWEHVVVEKDFIYALFNFGKRGTDKVPELQVWDWDGNLTARYQLDKWYDRFAVSDNGVLYAMDTMNHPYEVYTYNLNK